MSTSLEFDKLRQTWYDYFSQLENWDLLTSKEKDEVKAVMILMDVSDPMDLARLAILEYVQTIKENPDRWKYAQKGSCFGVF